MTRVAFVAGEPTASRIPQLDAIAELPDIDLTVFYASPAIQGRPWRLEPRHRAVFLRGPSLPLTRLLHHDYPVTPEIWRLLDRGRFDCVVIGGWSVFACQIAIIWAQRRRVPYLVFTENHDRERRPAWIRRLRHAVLPHVLRPAAGVLVPGTLARDHAIRHGADPDRIWRFANTVDVEAYDRRIVHDGIVVLQVSRLIPMKGVDRTIDAFATALTEMPELRLEIAGDGPDREQLERSAGAGVSFLGFLDRAALLNAYARADVFIQLSRRETWGIAVVEAAAAGLPLVLTDTVGAGADLLEPGGNGELVHDVDSAAAALVELARDTSLRERYGRRSRELASEWGYGPTVEAFREAVTAATASR